MNIQVADVMLGKRIDIVEISVGSRRPDLLGYGIDQVAQLPFAFAHGLVATNAFDMGPAPLHDGFDQSNLDTRPIMRVRMVHRHQSIEPAILYERTGNNGVDADRVKHAAAVCIQKFRIDVPQHQCAACLEFADGFRSEPFQAIMADCGGDASCAIVGANREVVLVIVHVGVGTA